MKFQHAYPELNFGQCTVCRFLEKGCRPPDDGSECNYREVDSEIDTTSKEQKPKPHVRQALRWRFFLFSYTKSVCQLKRKVVLRLYK